MELDECTQRDRDTLLAELFYRLDPDQRFHLMREFPGAYNRYVGRKCAVVGRAIDNPTFQEI